MKGQALRDRELSEAVGPQETGTAAVAVQLPDAGSETSRPQEFEVAFSEAEQRLDKYLFI